jgi:ankyrin repeat protein
MAGDSITRLPTLSIISPMNQVSPEEINMAITRRDVVKVNLLLDKIGTFHHFDLIAHNIVVQLIMYEMPQLISKCIDHGASYKQVYTDGMSALHVACLFEKMDAVLALLPYFPDVNIRDALNKTPMDRLLDTTHLVANQIRTILQNKGGISTSL